MFSLYFKLRIIHRTPSQINQSSIFKHMHSNLLSSFLNKKSNNFQHAFYSHTAYH